VVFTAAVRVWRGNVIAMVLTTSVRATRPRLGSPAFRRLRASALDGRSVSWLRQGGVLYGHKWASDRLPSNADRGRQRIVLPP
jgi:hypothetical protein